MTATTQDESATVQGEERMLIDGALVEGAGRPALRQHQPGHRGGARPGGRRRRRRHGSGHRRRPPGVRRDGLVDRSGVPSALPPSAARCSRGRAGAAAGRAGGRGRLSRRHHLRAPARRPAGGRPAVAGPDHRRLRVGARPADGRGLRHAQLAQGPEGAGRRGRGDHPLELPVRGDAAEAGPGAGDGQHPRRQAGPRHPLERHPHRPPRSPSRPTSRPAWSTWSRRRTTRWPSSSSSIRGST